MKALERSVSLDDLARGESPLAHDFVARLEIPGGASNAVVMSSQHYEKLVGGAAPCRVGARGNTTWGEPRSARVPQSLWGVLKWLTTVEPPKGVARAGMLPAGRDPSFVPPTGLGKRLCWLFTPAPHYLHPSRRQSYGPVVVHRRRVRKESSR